MSPQSDLKIANNLKQKRHSTQVGTIFDGSVDAYAESDDHESRPFLGCNK